MLSLFLYLAIMAQALSTPPINPAPVAQGCTSAANCTYTDNNVSPGQHFYFVEATNGQNSVPSNSVVVTVPNDGKTHNVALSWNPSPTPGVGYEIFRGAPATGLTIINSN